MEQTNVKEAGLRIYFILVNRGVIPAKEEEGLHYLNNIELRNFVRECASASGTEILEGSKYIHIVASERGSLFSTPYRELKESIGTDNQEQFQVLSLIAMIYLSEIDGDALIMNRMDYNGLSYIKLAEIVDRIIQAWNERMKEEPDFESKWSLNVQEALTLFLNKNLKDDNTTTLIPSFRTKVSIIHKIMIFLQNQQLVRIYKTRGTHMVYPTEILYERLSLAYREDTRYNALKKLIEKSKEDE